MHRYVVRFLCHKVTACSYTLLIITIMLRRFKMSKSKYKIYNGKSIKKLFENSRIYFLTAMFAAGLLVGAFMIKNETIADKISVITDTYSMLRAEQGILNNFYNSFAVNGIFIAITVFLGFSLIGYPCIIPLPFLRGIGIGAVSGYLYSIYKLSGLGYSLLMIYPGAVVSVFALILACNDSCEYGKNAYLKSIKGRGQFEKDETRVYLIRQLVFGGICAASSAIDAISCEIFSRFFEI